MCDDGGARFDHQRVISVGYYTHESLSGGYVHLDLVRPS
jgi:hypothetical protein